MGEVSPGVMPSTDIPLPVTHAYVLARDRAGDWATWRPITWLYGTASGSSTEDGHVKRMTLPHEASPQAPKQPALALLKIHTLAWGLQGRAPRAVPGAGRMWRRVPTPGWGGSSQELSLLAVPHWTQLRCPLGAR